MKVWFVNCYVSLSVPLEHFLYTGSNGKTRDERFLLLDSNGRFLEQGYKRAVQVNLSNFRLYFGLIF
jgi:hypothetical protein